MTEDITNIEQLLDRLVQAAEDRDRVCLRMIVEAVGSKSFGPLLLIAGVVLTSPLSGIPGIPTAMGLLVLLTSVQMLFGRKHFWLPRWLLNRSVSPKKLDRAMKWLRPPARLIDRALRFRLTMFVHRAGTYMIAIFCLLIGLGIPVMELVPFSATGAGVAVLAFGLALVASDGLLALLAFVITGTIFGLALWTLV